VLLQGFGMPQERALLGKNMRAKAGKKKDLIQ
jgi:hypothetical protein